MLGKAMYEVCYLALRGCFALLCLVDVIASFAILLEIDNVF